MIEGDKYWSYLKEAFNASTTLLRVGSINQAHKSGLPIYHFETGQTIANVNFSAII